MRAFRYALGVALCGAIVAIAFGSTEVGPGEGVAADRSLAITIDDLPLSGGRWSGRDLETTRQFNIRMLEALKAHDVPAIGFVNESRVHVNGELDERVAILRMWIEAGMDLGNHTFSHPDLNSTPLRDYQDDVIRGEVITRRLEEAGRELRFFRFPFNHRGNNHETKAAFEEFLDDRGYRIARFTVEHADYAFNVVYADARVNGDRALMARVKEAYLHHLDTKFSYFEQLSVELMGRDIPQILLIHVNEINAECLEEMLDRLEKRGYSFIALEDALADEAYSTPDEYVGRWGPSWLHRWTVAQGVPMRVDEPDPPSFVLDAYRTVKRSGGR